MNPPKGYINVPTRCPAFTRDNHFVYGYNGSTFNCRSASTCMYFADYIFEPKRALSIYDELEHTAREMAEQYGRFGIKISGLPIQYALADACRRVDVDFFQIVTQQSWMTEPYYPYDGRNQTVTVLADDKMLEDMVPEVVGITRSTSSGTLMKAFLSRVFVDPVVFGSGLTFSNMHHDGENAVGPEHWVLVDSEEDTAICRWWMNEGMTGCHGTARWSPELMASQLRQALRFFATPNGRSDDYWTDFYYFGLWEAPVQLTRDVDQQFYDWQANLEAMMKEEHDGGKHNEKWLTPVGTLYKSLGVAPPFDLEGDIEDIYGAVL